MRPNLAVLRSALDRMLTETGKLERPTGNTVYDPETQTEIPQVVTVYEDPALIRPRYQVAEEEAGGTTHVVVKYDVTLPAGTDARRGDVFTATATAPEDTAMTGERFTLLDVAVDAWQIARNCLAERFT